MFCSLLAFCSIPLSCLGRFNGRCCGLWAIGLRLKNGWIHGRRNADALWRFSSMYSYHTDSHGPSWTCWTQSSIMYMRLDLFTADFYIGAADHSVFDREQGRVRKYRQSTISILWTCFEKLVTFAQFLSSCLCSIATHQFWPFECSWNCLSNNVPPSVQVAVDQLPTDEVPHWKAEIRTIVHQAVLGSQSEVRSKISEADTHRTNVLLGKQTSYI